MEKVIRNGEVAIVYSPGFGAGWYSWNTENDQSEKLLFHPKLVEMVEQNRQSEITEEWVERELGLKNVYTGGASDLKIKWLPIGTRFILEEYDGNESVVEADSRIIVA